MVAIHVRVQESHVLRTTAPLTATNTGTCQSARITCPEGRDCLVSCMDPSHVHHLL